MSEDELLGAISYVVDSLINGFIFHPYTREDVRQEAFKYAFEALVRFNDTFKKTGTLEEKVRSFLFRHIRWRLMNFKRNEHGRSPARHKLNYALSIDGINDKDEENMRFLESDDLDLRAAQDKILLELDEEFRPDYYRMLAGVTLPRAQRDRLLTELRNILGVAHDEEEED